MFNTKYWNELRPKMEEQIKQFYDEQEGSGFSKVANTIVAIALIAAMMFMF
jgi:hypothetical protein